ncbi:hypothetical protein BC332_00873 [Capsicum chinense]|nr:hypothetical protein BC332_00873 [Capsicum chinense]
MTAEISLNSDPSPLSIFTTSSSLLTGEPAVASSLERANLSHIFGNGFVVLIDSIEMVMKVEDAASTESILDQFILTKPILVHRVGCLKAVSFDCFSRGQHGAVKMTIEVMAMKQHGNRGFPDGEISAAGGEQKEETDLVRFFLLILLIVKVYAPLTEKDSTFHRTLFIFMCTSMACLLKDQHEQWKRNQDKPSRSVKVFRCQLPRYNSFYSSEPPKNNGKDKPSSAGAVLCGWCGTWRGDKVCGSCRRVHYCSEKHQAVHRKSGHKRRCLPSSISQDASEPRNNRTLRGVQEVASNGLWPEYEIAITDECEDKVSDDNGQVNLLISSSRVDESIEAIMDSFGGEDDKKSWASFQERISRTPEQVLPQILYYFGVENDAQSLDWATIAVYTCESSCDGNVAYKEFAWVQIASQSSTTQR